ncbi:DUF262 domain-containing protein [Flavobacterium arcticum]|uniref:DUF262 domain-containing protein n=1 Tax=Flavobacterium arcticum TaxID=1784713 RepID=A0A345HB76_9FLAO|nr:DUF262 domain-containing protein [Flavobacterium arcticum]AXG73836.1 DUF262 domain-containing protein [Flavobacterium arcticum]KAF2511788.1 DUF262 domain-containing protein [Flavobacterium arcticum]
MGTSKIELKSINDLLKFEFLIPSYQRGYRWNKTQVVDLLNDIYEFIQNKESKSQLVGDFYCLQPVILNKVTELNFRLIDGQQRLTTIYIILVYLEKKRFSLEFETREKSKTFLNNISEDINNENIDFHHISKAFAIIKKWFEEKEENESTIKEEFYINLGKYTKVIWYEIEDNEDEIEVFTRINSGKIPLTNAELIKALFLNSKNFATAEKYLRQIEIAKEWDEIELTLQNDEFWHFLTKRKEYPTRIELLFEIFSTEPIKDEFSTYRFFAKQKLITNLWAEDSENIKKIFLSLKYWFDNRKLFHLIGYLISTDTYSVDGIYKLFKGKNKSQFVDDLLLKIKSDVNVNKIEILDYSNNYAEVFKVLLLFNVATILNNSNSYIRFAFDKFNRENWSIEHIHAKKDKGLQSTDSIIGWLKDVQKQIKAIDVKDKEQLQKKKNKIILETQRLSNLSKITKDDKEFRSVQNIIFEFFGQPDVDTIDNLALLSNSVNSSLGNSFFPLKRKLLLEKDKNGEFIPICTKNVFLKYYSQNANDLFFWNNTDRIDYVKEIKSVIKNF